MENGILRPVIKSISSVDWDLKTCVFGDSKRIGLHVEIGDEASSGADLYQMEVVNDLWIMEHAREFSWSWGRARILMFEFDVAVIQSELTDKISRFGPYRTWPEFAVRMSNYLVWEFEGMEYPPS